MAQTPINAANVLATPIADAFGVDTTVKTNIFGDINDDFNTQKAEKKAEYKSLTDIGNELDAARYSQLEGGINSLLEKASNGSLVVGSPEWVKQTANLKASANQLAEASKIDADIRKLAVENPEQFTFLEDAGNGEIMDTGIGGYLNRMIEASQDKTITSPQEYINKTNQIAKRAIMAPRSIAAGYKDLATQAVQLNKKLNDESVGVPKLVNVKLGNNQAIQITSSLTPEDTQQVVNMFVNQFAGDIGREYAQMVAKNKVPPKRDDKGNIIKDERGNPVKMTSQEYITSQVEAYITKGNTTTELRSTGGGGSTATERKQQAQFNKEVEAAKDVKADVDSAQKSNDPTKLNKYLRGNGFEVIVRPDGMWRIIEIGKAKDDDRTISVINPNEASEVYDAIAANNPNITRDGIDAIEYNTTSGDETPEQKEIRISVEKEEKTLDRVLDTLGKPKGKTISPTKQEDAGVSNLKYQKNFLNGIGVDFVQNTNMWGGKDPKGQIIKIIVDGTTYDMRDADDATKANAAIKAKLRSKLNTSGDKPQTGTTANPTKPKFN